MGVVWWGLAKGIFITAVCVIVGFAVADWNGALAALAVCTAFGLLVQFYYLLKLASWLEKPQSDTVPQPADGMWRGIFSALLQYAQGRDERKRKLAQSLMRFNRATEAMPNGVLVLDSGGKITWVNRLAVEHLNLDPQHDWGRALAEVMPDGTLQEFLDTPLEQSIEYKLVLPKKPVGERFVHVIRVPFDDTDQLLITRDISEAEQLNATRTAFVANVSHELRTPLTVINGFLETMADTPDLPAEQSQRFIGLMRKEGSRMQNLLADLLTLSRLESGVAAEHTPINLSQLTALLVEDGQHLSGSRHTVSADIQDDLWVRGVYTDLYNGLSNIIFNAVRYTPTGGSIEVRLHELPNHNPFTLPEIRFSVRDNGPGIAAQHIPHLTERFYRVDKGRSRRTGGTGLGLAITKHALAEHHAVLSIHSEVGIGSEFSTVFKQLDKQSIAAHTDDAGHQKEIEAA